MQLLLADFIIWSSLSADYISPVFDIWYNNRIITHKMNTYFGSGMISVLNTWFDTEWSEFNVVKAALEEILSRVGLMRLSANETD